MKFKKGMFFLFATTFLASTSMLAISCSKQKEVYLDINKISRLFLNRLTLSQIASIEKDQKIFYYFENNQKNPFDNVKIKFDEKANKQKMFLLKKNQWIEYQPDFPYKNNWEQTITDNNNIRIFHSNKKADINNFLSMSFDFNEIDLANDYEEWLINWAAKKNVDFKPEQYQYPEDLQTIIFRLNDDIKDNYFIMNKNYIKNSSGKITLFSDWMQPQYIQASAFLDHEHQQQRKTFTQLLKLYLNQFNVNVAEIEIDWKNAKIKQSLSSPEDFVEFQIKSIKDWNNSELLEQKNQNKTFYLNGFRNYAWNGKFGVGKDGLKENLPLFNDYVENPLLYMDGKKYLTIIDNINHFIKAPTSPEYWNAKGLMYLFNEFKDEILKIKIPEYRQNEDLEYKIEEFEFSDYLDTNQVFKAIVNVTKKNGSSKKYLWLSSNFDDHGHRLKGMIFKNKINPQSSDIYSFNPTNKGIPEGIKLEEFVSNKEDSAFMVGLNHASNKLNSLFNYWNNDSRQNFDPSLLNNDSYQIKVFNAYLNNYLLAYALENKEKHTLSGIKRIDIKLNPEKNKLGQLYFELLFIGFGENDYQFKSNKEKIVAKSVLYWNYFKSYDESISKNNFMFVNENKKVERME